MNEGSRARTASLLRHGAWAATLLVGVIVGTFLLFKVVPGDPARAILGPNASESRVAELRQALGTDQPLVHQLADYLQGLARLDLGRSIVDGRSVRAEVLQKFAVTAKLGVLAGVIALLVSYGINLLVYLVPRVRWLVGAVRWGVVVPTFFSGVVAALVFGVWLPFLPLTAYGSASASWAALLVPAFIIALYPIALMTRLLHEQIRETSGSPHAVAARALGHSKSYVFHHALLRPVAVTWLAAWVNQLSVIFVASFILEVIFTIPGVGPLLLSAIQSRDYPMLQGIVLVNALFFIALHFASEVAFAKLDPRSEEDVAA